MECTVVTAERDVRNVIVGCQGSDVNASVDVKFPLIKQTKCLHSCEP